MDGEALIRLSYPLKYLLKLFKIFDIIFIESWEKKVFSFLLSSLIEPVKPPTSVVRSASRDKGWAPAGFVSKINLVTSIKQSFLRLSLMESLTENQKLIRPF